MVDYGTFYNPFPRPGPEPIPSPEPVPVYPIEWWKAAMLLLGVESRRVGGGGVQAGV